MNMPSFPDLLAKEFAAFALSLSSGERQWFYWRRCAIYTRRSTRFYGGIPAPSLDLANITIRPQGRGALGRLLDTLLALRASPWSYLYIESVQDPRFAAFLTREGWTQDPFSLDSPFPSFFHEIDKRPSLADAP